MLRKWIAESKEGFIPTRTVMMGKMRIYLYTDDDLERIKHLHEHEQQVAKFKHSSGRPRKFTDEERVARNRLHSRRYYWGLRRDEAIFRGDADLLRRADHFIESITEQLKEEQ